MEKFLWNLVGVVLFISNVLVLLLCLVLDSEFLIVAMIGLAMLSLIYKEKRPTWIEV